MAWQRTVALVILLAADIFSLPVAAYFFDSPGSETWIVPVQLAAMALIGALVGRLLPELTGANAPSSRATWRGAAIGIGMGLVGIVIFFLLLNGFSGA